jgi:hypothetical protein
MADNIRVNGNAISWGSITLKIGNEKYHGFNLLNYGDKRTRTKGYGMGKHHAPRSRSRGKYETDPVKLRGPKSTIEAVRAALAFSSVDGRSYGDTECLIVSEYVEADETPMLVELHRCVVVADTSNHEENPDPLMDELEFDTMKVVRNGRTLFDSNGEPTP